MITRIRIDMIHDGGAVTSTLFGLDKADRVRVERQEGALGDARLSAAILNAGASVLEVVHGAQRRPDAL